MLLPTEGKVVKLVTSTRLAEKLEVTTDALNDWRRAKILLPAQIINRIPHYTIASVDSFLQRGKVKNHRIVSAIDIIEGRVKLLTTPEVAKRLKVTRQTVDYRISHGYYPALWLGGELRMVEADIGAILAGNEYPDYIGRELTAHILGSPTHYIRHLVRNGDLRSITVYTKPTTMPITRESILALVKKLAPEWVNPEAWVAERENDERPLMTLEEVVRFLGLPQVAGRDIVKHRKLAYLKIKGGVLMISPISAMLLLQEQDKLTTQQLANIFGGVDEYTIKRAQKAGDLRCEFHFHTDNDLRRGCIVEMLRTTCLSPAVKYEVRWFDHYLKKPKPLMTVPEAAIKYRISEQEVLNRIQSGKLRAVKLPGKDTPWRIEGPTR